MSLLAFKALAYGADKIPDKVFNAVPGGLYKTRTEVVEDKKRGEKIVRRRDYSAGGRGRQRETEYYEYPRDPRDPRGDADEYSYYPRKEGRNHHRRWSSFDGIHGDAPREYTREEIKYTQQAPQPPPPQSQRAVARSPPQEQQQQSPYNSERKADPSAPLKPYNPQDYARTSTTTSSSNSGVAAETTSRAGPIFGEYAVQSQSPQLQQQQMQAQFQQDPTTTAAAVGSVYGQPAGEQHRPGYYVPVDYNYSPHTQQQAQVYNQPIPPQAAVAQNYAVGPYQPGPYGHQQPVDYANAYAAGGRPSQAFNRQPSYSQPASRSGSRKGRRKSRGADRDGQRSSSDHSSHKRSKSANNLKDKIQAMKEKDRRMAAASAGAVGGGLVAHGLSHTTFGTLLGAALGGMCLRELEKHSKFNSERNPHAKKREQEFRGERSSDSSSDSDSGSSDSDDDEHRYSTGMNTRANYQHGAYYQNYDMNGAFTGGARPRRYSMGR